MIRNRSATVWVAGAVAALLSAGAWGLLQRSHAGSPQDRAAAKEKAAEADEGPKSRDYLLVPARREGVIAFLGRPVKKDEKVDERDLRKVVVAGVEMKLVRLREGDRVERGQLLGRIDDVLARKEMQIREAKLAVAEAESRASKATEEEAKVRYDRVLKLAGTAAVSQEEVAGARLTYQRFAEEVKGRTAAVLIAKHELEQGAVLLEMHEVRSPVSGVLQAILRREGEAVRLFDPVFRIKFDEK